MVTKCSIFSETGKKKDEKYLFMLHQQMFYFGLKCQSDTINPNSPLAFLLNTNAVRRNDLSQSNNRQTWEQTANKINQRPTWHPWRKVYWMENDSPTKPPGPTSFRAILSARMDELPWAMSADGLVWINTGVPWGWETRPEQRATKTKHMKSYDDNIL